MKPKRRQASKFTVITLMPILALGLLGLTYGHWQEPLTIKGIIATGKAEAQIKIFKICIFPCRPTSYWLSPDNQTLNIQIEDVTDCCYLGIAMIIKNTGTLPIWTYNNTYTITDENGKSVEGNFTLKQWFFGPFDGEPPITDDPPESDSDYNCPWLKKPPIQLDPQWKLLILMLIHCDQGQHQAIQIAITLNYQVWTGNCP